MSEVILSDEYRRLQLDPAQVARILGEASDELTGDFLFFRQAYEAVARHADRSLRVVDVGCYVGFQQALFEGFSGYVGIDHYDLGTCQLPGWPCPPRYVHPPMRDRVTHVSADAAKWIGGAISVPRPGEYLVCSAVPGVMPTDRAVIRVLSVAFPSGGCIWYPGAGCAAWGLGADAIARDADAADALDL